MCNTLFLLGDTCTFNTEILVHLKCLKQVILPHFERFFDDTCKFEVHSCYLSKTKDFGCTCMVSRVARNGFIT